MKLSKIIECIKNYNFIKYYLKGVSPLFELKNFLLKINSIGTLIDVGSNKGQFILLFRMYFPKIKVHSFEPQDEPLKIQKKIFKYNKINYYPYALGNKNEIKIFYQTKREDSSSLLKPKIKTKSDYKIINKKKIKVKKIKDILNFNKLKKPIILKLDVQGFELEVLKGFEKNIKYIDYIITEISYLNSYTNGVSARKLIKYLNNNKFYITERTNQTKHNGKIYQEDILLKKIMNK